MVAGDIEATNGSISRSGGLGIIRQFIGNVCDESTVRDLLLSVAPPRVRAAAAAVDEVELQMMDTDEPTQVRYATVLAEYADAGGYDIEVVWDVCQVKPKGGRTGVRAITCKQLELAARTAPANHTSCGCSVAAR